MPMSLRALLLGIVSVAALRGLATAAEPVPGAVPARVSRLSDREVERRLDYLEERLDSGRDYAWYWWNGWTTFYALGVVIEGTRAGLADGGSARADNVVSAVKATGGVINLLRKPLAAKDGADGVRALPHSTSEDRRRQLVAAEDQLRANAEDADARYSWLRHGLNVGVNAAGAVIVWQGFDDRTRAWRSAGIGIAVGEAMIWSQPWWPAQELEDYNRRFDGDSGRQISWHLIPTIGGAALQVNF